MPQAICYHSGEAQALRYYRRYSQLPRVQIYTQQEAAKVSFESLILTAIFYFWIFDVSKISGKMSDNLKVNCTFMVVIILVIHVVFIWNIRDQWTAPRNCPLLIMFSPSLSALKYGMRLITRSFLSGGYNITKATICSTQTFYKLLILSYSEDIYLSPLNWHAYFSIFHFHTNLYWYNSSVIKSKYDTIIPCHKWSQIIP